MPKNTVTIGSDPEYIYIEGEKPVGAYIDKDFQIGEVGKDGHQFTGEIRPKHSKNVDEHIDNIHSLIKVIHTYSPKALAGNYVKSCKEPLGGHVHLGSKRLKEIAKQPFRSPLDPLLLNNLALVAITNLFVEDEENARLRRDEYSYGRLLDYRWQKHGIEYRTFGSWLCSPAVAAYTLTACCAITKAWEEEKKLLLPIEITDTDTLQFKRAEKEYFAPNLKQIQNQIDKVVINIFGKWSKEYSYIKAFNSLLKNGKTWQEEKPFPPKWGKKMFPIKWSTFTKRGDKINRDVEQALPLKLEIIETDERLQNISYCGLPFNIFPIKWKEISGTYSTTYNHPHAIFVPTKIIKEKPKTTALQLLKIIKKINEFYKRTT